MGKELPGKHTTLVPLLPKQRRKEHHSISPPSVPTKTVGFKKHRQEKEWTFSQNPSLLRYLAHLRSTEAGDVRAATRGSHNAVARTPWIVVVYLGT